MRRCIPVVAGLLCIASVVSALKSGIRCGHHGTPQEGPDEEQADLSPERFWNEYVRKMKPVIIRGAVADDLGLKRWNDEYVLKNYGHMKVRMEPKDEGGSRIGNMPSVDTMSNFYSKWIKTGYTVTQLPGGMNNESSIISCISCGPIRDQFIESNLWISNGDTNSKIHKDSNNQMNCLYQGTKEWTLFPPEHGRSLYLVQERPDLDQVYDTAGFSRLNTRDMDLNRYPKVKQVPFQKVLVKPGDCLYVPGTYIHHVYSSGERNMQVSMLFAGPGTPTSMPRVHGRTLQGKTFAEADHNGNECPADGSGKSDLLGNIDVAWAYDGIGPITMGFANPSSYAKSWKQLVARAAGRSGTVNKKAFIAIFVRFIDDMDPCNDRTAAFGNEPESRRHVFEALDVLFPEHEGKWTHWNATCDRLCRVPKICTIMKQAVKDEAGALFDKLSTDGKLQAAVFEKQSRRQLQDALVSVFVRDQVAAVFEEVTGDYQGYSQGSGGGGGGEEEDDDDDEEERDDL